MIETVVVGAAADVRAMVRIPLQVEVGVEVVQIRHWPRRMRMW